MTLTAKPKFFYAISLFSLFSQLLNCTLYSTVLQYSFLEMAGSWLEGLPEFLWNKPISYCHSISIFAEQTRSSTCQLSILYILLCVRCMDMDLSKSNNVQFDIEHVITGLCSMLLWPLWPIISIPIRGYYRTIIGQTILRAIMLKDSMKRLCTMRL